MIANTIPQVSEEGRLFHSLSESDKGNFITSSKGISSQVSFEEVINTSNIT